MYGSSNGVWSRISLQAIYLKQNAMDSLFVPLRRLTFWAGILVLGDSRALALNVLIRGMRTPAALICRGKVRTNQDFHRVAMGLRGRSYG